jgi:hypothetical protein
LVSRKIVCRGGLLRAARNGSIDPEPHSSDKTNLIDRIGEPVAQVVKGSRASVDPENKEAEPLRRKTKLFRFTANCIQRP